MPKKDKLRGFVFYAQDYFGDVAVRLMPGYLRIVWVEAFLLMDQSPRRGVLLKKNGEPYTAKELADVMNVPVEHVQEAHDWILREEIAGQDRNTKALINRRMIRDSKRREINSKNGRKGGNPSLVTKGTNTALQGSVNRIDNRLVKAKPDPDPDPEVVPLLINNSSLEVYPPTEKRGGRQPDEAADYFAATHLEATKVPYIFREPDWVHVAKLRKAYGIGHRDTPPGWNAAVGNYFASPQSKTSMADFVVRYSVFHNSPVNEFRTPINHQGNGNGQHKESREARIARVNRENAIEFDKQLFGATGDSGGDGTDERPKATLLPGAKGHR
jgi:hypothetical protein